jgi:predicted metal-dependent HD superfamily phosphohydrolase
MDEGTIRRSQGELRKHPIVQEALKLLGRELPASVFYHSLGHTEDVLDESLRFGVTDRLSPRELELLAIAAACHDVGYISAPLLNEPLGAAFARERMARHGGYTEGEIALVERMILDTALVTTDKVPHQVASTELSRYLLDADLSNVGREDFFEKAELLRKELGVEIDIFRRDSLAFVTAHRWHTAAALALRQEGKERNVQALRAMVLPS